MLKSGEKVLVAHRRLFERDEPRYLVGNVDASEGTVIKVTGYSFVRDMSGGGVLRKDDPRTKIISVASGSVLVYQLPDQTDVASVRFILQDGELSLTDGGRLHMNMTEWSRHGHV